MLGDSADKNAWLSWLEIDLAAVRHNFRLMRGLLTGGAELFAVVKADAYGHGAIEVARLLEDEDTPMMCVARIEEALELREAGIRKPMLVFAPPVDGQARLYAPAEAAAVVCAKEHVECMAAAASAAGRELRVHLKVDTGMRRIGVEPSDAVELAHMIAGTPGLVLEGVMTHFSSADRPPRSVTEEQIAIFSEVRRAILETGISVRYFHAANSAGIMEYPESHFSAGRAGIALYGIYPDAAMQRRHDLRPAMRLMTRVAYVKTVPAGTGVSYGHIFTTQHEARIATVPIGYADGFPRHASNSASLLVRGRLAPQIGRVCMDQILLDVTNIPGVRVGDEVLAFGSADVPGLRAEDVAVRFGSIGYELTTRIGKRLPRTFEDGTAQA